MFICVAHAQYIERLLTVKLKKKILMWPLDNSALLCQTLLKGQYWKMFCCCLLHILTSILTELDPHMLRKKSNTPWGEEQERKSEQKLISVRRKTSIHKAHTQDNVSGKFLQRLKTNVVTHHTHMSHKPLLSKVSCLFSYSEPFFPPQVAAFKNNNKKNEKKSCCFFIPAQWVSYSDGDPLSFPRIERTSSSRTHKKAVNWTGWKNL